ncbi:hypothetical protein OIU84_004505 [Salix udensis]|uniref:Uncharacterized protein n=1 Tax=Salix udensis TaxID=889485 RepID=A0AAD6K480_9ROSI|nr:hypothetical protein OIU84_004505 [Salix udensis]
MAQSHRCAVVPSLRQSIIHECDEIKMVLARLIRADNLRCSTLRNMPPGFWIFFIRFP